MALLALILVAVAGVGTGYQGVADAAHGHRLQAAVPASGRGAGRGVRLPVQPHTDAFTGAYGTASEIGWQGNGQGVVTCLGGTFVIQDGINQALGFGLYTGTPTTWSDADGYLPAQVTTFRRPGVVVSITEFGDRVVLDGHAYVAVYSRVAVQNVTDRVVSADPTTLTGPGAAQLGSEPGEATPARRP